MKTLLMYWWNKEEKNPWKEIFLIAAAILLILALWQCILPKEQRRIFSFDADRMVLTCVAALAVVMLVVGAIGTGRNVTRAIRFRKAFGFWLPSTENGLVGLKGSVSRVLKGFAERLNRSCEAEERMSFELPNSDDPKHTLALERNLRQNKKAIKDRRKEFYSRRNLAKAVGIETHKSYKDYLGK